VGSVASDAGRVAAFFESFNARLTALARRIGEFFDSGVPLEPAPPSMRLSESRSVQAARALAARAPAIDLAARLSSFQLTGGDSTTQKLQDGQRWKRDLAGLSADQPADPNGKLRIPVSVTASRPLSREV
jgi:hypothetical protein